MPPLLGRPYVCFMILGRNSVLNGLRQDIPALQPFTFTFIYFLFLFIIIKNIAELFLLKPWRLKGFFNLK